MRPTSRQFTKLTAALAATAAPLAMLAQAPLAADGAVLTPAAHGASTTALSETGQLHLLSKSGFTLNEQGTASGTIRGPIYVRLTIVSTTRVSVEVTISPRGGSISGAGTASYHKGSASASFAGGMSVEHRSGSYAHAQGSGLSFSGTIARSDDAITVHVSGRLSD